MSIENPFEKSKTEQQEADTERKMVQEAAFDKQGMPHFADTRDEAMKKAAEANEGLK